MNERYYFAYGSNLNIFQMLKRVGEWKTSSRAYLENYKLVFNVKSSRWGGMAANVQKTNDPQDRVYGAIYLLTEQKIAVMTNYENIPITTIDVKLEDGFVVHDVVMYKWDVTRPTETPPVAYKNTILEGLIQHGYPNEIVKKIEKIAS